MSKETRIAVAGELGAILWGVGAFAQVPDPPRPLRIVVPFRPPSPVQLAAEELVRYLTAMGNPRPQVVHAPDSGDIYLGSLPSKTASEDVGEIRITLRGVDEDSFVVRSVRDQLVIYGNSPRAVLYGVYHYLETLGVRWYFPGPDNEVVPQAIAKLQGYNIRQVPSFHKRGIVIFSTTPDFEDLVDFATKIKLNTIGLHALPYGPQNVDIGVADAMRITEPRGLELDVNRHFFGDTYCPDNSAALARDQKRLLDYVALLPSNMNEFFLYPADKYLSPCASPAYRNYSVSDLMLWFDNQMVKTLRSVRPQAKFVFSSYLRTWEPPKHGTPDPGLILEWAPIFQSFAHSLDDPASTLNAQYRRDFEDLIRIFGAEKSQVLGYWLDDTLFSRTFYGHLPYQPKALKEDLSYYHRMHVPAVTTFGVIIGRDYFLSHASPVVFLYPTLLWNIHSNPQEVVRRFCQDYLGSEQALEIFDALARADHLVYVERSRVHAQKLTAGEFVAEVSKALRMSQELLNSQTDPVRRARAALLVQEVSSRFINPKSLPRWLSAWERWEKADK